MAIYRIESTRRRLKPFRAHTYVDALRIFARAINKRASKLGGAISRAEDERATIFDSRGATFDILELRRLY